MQQILPHRQSRPVLKACNGCIAFRQASARTARLHCARARVHQACVTASATKEDVQEVQESSNAGRKLDPNGGDLMSWEEIGERAGTDVLQGYQMLDHSGHTGQPRTAPTRVLPTDESTTTDRPVLLYRDTNGWCPFCERVRTSSHLYLSERQHALLIDMRVSPPFQRCTGPFPLGLAGSRREEHPIRHSSD